MPCCVLATNLGMLVWEEIPVVDLIVWVTSSARMPQRLARNDPPALQPSVRHYVGVYERRLLSSCSIGWRNNGSTGFYENTLALARHLEETSKREDPTSEYDGYHGNQIYNKNWSSNITDISGWNLYQGWYENDFKSFDRFVDEEHRKYPHRPLIISEFGAGSDSRFAVAWSADIRFLHAMAAVVSRISARYHEATVHSRRHGGTSLISVLPVARRLRRIILIKRTDVQWPPS